MLVSTSTSVLRPDAQRQLRSNRQNPFSIPETQPDSRLPFRLSQLLHSKKRKPSSTTLSIPISGDTRGSVQWRSSETLAPPLRNQIPGSPREVPERTLFIRRPNAGGANATGMCRITLKASRSLRRDIFLSMSRLSLSEAAGGESLGDKNRAFREA